MNIDTRFKVDVLAKAQNPQQMIYQAMHQDYSENYVAYEQLPSEQQCGKIIVNRLLTGNRGHYGCFEHPSIILNCGWFPHSVVQQIRTHRVGTSFDVQSNRYTSQRFIKAAATIQLACKSHNPDYREINYQIPRNPDIQSAIEDVIYFRPEGEYTNRNGHKYYYDDVLRMEDILDAAQALIRYAVKLEHGMSPEHARGLLPFDVRQHWVMSLNARSLMHLLDLRWKKDAQLECQWLCDLIGLHFEEWVPEVAAWYMNNRAQKGRLAP